MTVRKVYWNDSLLHTEIKRFNPAYDGSAKFSIENGVPVAVDLSKQKVDNLRCFDGVPLQALDISDTGVSDLSPLKGLPLVQFMAERSKVMNLKPLAGAPIENIYLSETPVSDLSGLEGMPLQEVNLVGTKVNDLTPLAKCPIRMLWLTDCPVTSIAPLKGMPLESVTLHRTKVVDLTPLSGSGLQRLHIAETPVMDLTPLKGMALTRLVFTPANIKTGLDVARALPLQEIGTRFDDGGKDLGPPDVFWQTVANPVPAK